MRGSFRESPRERQEKLEHLILSPFASFADESRGRDRVEDDCDLRTVYQRDRDRILHSKSFRRMKHKTQVFLEPEGDHYRTRLTHTLEVAQIARSIARALRLNEDLTEAIALGHDLGHTPFGHAGERALTEVAPFTFRHNEQSVRVVEKIERRGAGLNLTWEVRDGMRNHRSACTPATLEGKIVRLSDKIAYVNHDIDDAIRAGIIREEDLPREATDLLGHTVSDRIDAMIRNTVLASADILEEAEMMLADGVELPAIETDIVMEKEVFAAMQELRTFLSKNVYSNPAAKSQEVQAENLVKYLYSYFLAHPEEVPEEYHACAEAEGMERMVVDYIATMSDDYAVKMIEGIFVPMRWDVY